MEAVIKVILHACKTHCGKDVPSKKEIAAVISLLEKEGMLTSPSDLYDPNNWDALTKALSQRVLATRKVTEFKVWGLVLEALKAAREEKIAGDRARELLGLGARGTGGGLISPTDPKEEKMAPTPLAPTDVTPSRTKKEEVEQDHSAPEYTPPPPPYPARRLYPSLKSFMDEGGGGPSVECTVALCTTDKRAVGEDGTVSLPGSACCSSHSPEGADHSAQQGTGCGRSTSMQTAPGHAQEGCGPVASGPWSPPTLTDWARVREDLRAADVTDTFAFPVTVNTEGTAWTPLNSKAVTRLADLVKNKGLRSPVTMAAVEALMASSLLPYDVVSLMRVILEPVQYTLWYDEWNRLLQVVVAAATRDNNHPANGQGRKDKTTLARLQGLADGMVGSPEGQANALRAGELAALTTAALQALRMVAKVAEPVLPWTDIKQEPSEPFSDFANRLIRAVEGSDLPKGVQSLVVIDCLKQKSLPDIQQIIRAAPRTLNTPGEIIKYVLDHQKNAPLTNEGFVTAMQGMAAAVMAASRVGENKDKGPCFKCGQLGHLKAQCPKRFNQKESQGLGEPCQLCGWAGHDAHQCQKFKVLPQENWYGRVPMAQGSFPLF